MRAARRRAAPGRDAAGVAVPHVVRHPDRRATSCCCAPSPTTPRAGASASRWRTRCTPRSTSTARPTCMRRHLLPPGASPEDAARHRATRSRRVLHRSRATGWRRPRSRWRCSTPSCGPTGRSWARELGAVRDRVPSRRVGRHHRQHPAAARRRRRLPRRGLRADQAQDRAGLGRRAGARRPRALRRRRAAAGRRQHRVHPARRPPPRQARRLRPAAHRAAARGGGHARPRRARPARSRTPVCLDESIVSAQTAAAAIALGALLDHQHQAGPGRRLPRGAAHPRPRPSPTASPVWCGGMLETGLGRAANAALAALPGFTLPGDISASRPLLPDRHHRAVRPSPDGHMDVPTGPGLGVDPDPGDPRRRSPRRRSGSRSESRNVTAPASPILGP